MQSYERSHRFAFTLVELLVVIGIIAILIAILLPALSRVQHQAMVVNCASNQRQIGTSQHNYATDHKGKVTPSNYGDHSPYNYAGVGTPWIKGGYANPGGAEGTWIGMGMLFSTGYIDGGRVIYDPHAQHENYEYESATVGWRNGRPWTSGNRWMNNSYIQRASIGAENNSIQRVDTNPLNGNGRQVNIALDPGGTAFITCRNDFAGSTSPDKSWVDWTHTDGYNVLYVDASVEYVNIYGVNGQTADPNLPGSQDLSIANYIKAMGISSYKYRPKEMERVFYYKLDRTHPDEVPTP